jgi:beta-lactam-binding protein with PASTA domain
MCIRDRLRRYLIAMAIVLVVIGAYAGSQLARVPSVTGTYVHASDVLDKAGFRVRAVDASGASSEPHDLEIVVSQDPRAGAWRTFGSTVTLRTRVPRERVVVPDVVGKRLSDAADVVHDAGLMLDTGGYIPDDGIVESTVPTAGASMRFGSKVIYTLEVQR